MFTLKSTTNDFVGDDFRKADTDTSSIFDETPLILACKAGDLDVVRALVEISKVDVDQRAKISILPEVTGTTFRIYEGTALHAAIISGHYDLVWYLCSLGNANVNAIAWMHSLISSERNAKVLTPLHLAIVCEWLTPEMKRELFLCLIEYGADWRINDHAGRQCWEYTSDVAITRCMIFHCVGLHSTQNKSSSNIVHKWARSSDLNASSLIIDAIKRGADLFQVDHNGLTPLMAAATRGQPDILIFEIILHSMNGPNSRLYKIDGLELMGATHINEGNRIEGVNCWKMAMNLRLDVAGEPSVPKPPTVLNESFRAILNGATEIQTLEDIESLQLDNTNIPIIQAQLVYFRILGIKNIETINYLTRYSVSHFRRMNKQKIFQYAKLISDNYDLTNDPFWQKWTVFNFFSMFSVGRLDPALLDEATISDGIIFLRQLTDRLQKTSSNVRYPTPFGWDTWDNDIIDDENGGIGFILNSILFWTNVVASYLILHPNEPLKLELKRCLFEVIRLERRDSQGNDLLLLACAACHWFLIKRPKSNNCDIGFVGSRPIVDSVFSLLIECGAQPNSVNNKRETGLHILARNEKTFSSQAIKILHMAGTHIDHVDASGKTMTHVISRTSRIPYAQCVVDANKLEFPTLKCMCCRILKRSTISLYKHFPKRLAKFIEIH